MDEMTIRELRRLVRTSIGNMNQMWDQTTESGHKWLCKAYEDLSKVYEIVENEIDHLEGDA